MSKKLIIKLLRLPLISYLGVCVAMLFMQSCAIYHPQAGPLTWTPADLGLKYENLRLQSEDEEIHGWYIPSAEDEGTVLFCHGNAGNLSHRLATVQAWNRLGFNLMIFDYRGYGESSGSPDEEGCYADGEAAYLWLQKKGLTEKRFFIHGRSLGGGTASYLAEKFPCNGLILESTFTSVPDMADEILTWLPTSLLVWTDFDSFERVPRLKCPLLVLHSMHDEVIPGKMGKKLAEAGRGTFVELQGDHNSGWLMSPVYLPALRKFVE